MPTQLRAVLSAILASAAGALGMTYAGDPWPVIFAVIAWVAGALGDWYATRNREGQP